MVESGEHRDCVNASLGLRWTGNGLLVRESLVRASLVVETHVLGNDASKVFLAEDEDVIEQLSSERACPWPKLDLKAVGQTVARSALSAVAFKNGAGQESQQSAA